MSPQDRESGARSVGHARWDAADKRAGTILFGIVLAVVLALGWLVVDVPRADELWYAEFDQAGGLAEQAPVQVEGFTVGRVTSVRPIIDDSGTVRFRVTLRIPTSRDPIPMPEGTVARLIPPVVVGQATIALVRPVNSNVMLAPGSTFRGERLPSLIDDVARTVTELRRAALSANENLSRLSDSLSGVARGVRGDVGSLAVSVQQVLVRTELALAAVERDAQMLGEVLDDARPIPERTLALMDSLGLLAAELRMTTARMDSLTVSESPAIRRIVAQLDTASVAVNYVLKRFARRPMRFFTGIDTTSFPTPAQPPP